MQPCSTAVQRIAGSGHTLLAQPEKAKRIGTGVASVRTDISGPVGRIVAGSTICLCVLRSLAVTVLQAQLHAGSMSGNDLCCQGAHIEREPHSQVQNTQDSRRWEEGVDRGPDCAKALGRNQSSCDQQGRWKLVEESLQYGSLRKVSERLTEVWLFSIRSVAIGSSQNFSDLCLKFSVQLLHGGARVCNWDNRLASGLLPLKHVPGGTGSKWRYLFVYTHTHTCQVSLSQPSG